MLDLVPFGLRPFSKKCLSRFSAIGSDKLAMKTAQLKSISLLAVAVLCIRVSALAVEYDYYGTLHYPKELVPSMALKA